MPDGKQYLIREIERKLILALCGASKKAKELINSALEDLEKLKMRIPAKGKIELAAVAGKLIGD